MSVWKWRIESLINNDEVDVCSLHNAVDYFLVMGQTDFGWGTWKWTEEKGFYDEHQHDNYSNAKADFINRLKD